MVEKRLVHTVQIIITGGLSMFDVYSDYFLLSTYYGTENFWFLFSAAIVGFAALAQMVNIMRGYYGAKLPLKLFFTIVSAVQGHWVFLLIFMYTSTRFDYLVAYTAFDYNALLEVIFESVPQLYLQLYIVLYQFIEVAQGRSLDAGTFQIQMASIIFSLLMATKTLAVRSFQNSAGLQMTYDAEKKVNLLGKGFIAMHTLSSLVSRALVLALGAVISIAYESKRLLGSVEASKTSDGIFLDLDFIKLVGIMIAIRAAYSIWVYRTGISMKSLPFVIYSVVSNTIATMVRDFYEDYVLEALSVLEAILILVSTNAWINRQINDENFKQQLSFFNGTSFNSSYVFKNDTTEYTPHGDRETIQRFSTLSEVHTASIILVILHLFSTLSLFLLKRSGRGVSKPSFKEEA